ncbi:heterokaryon incompatibility protein-domain-containing protein [Xylogone sp. PMI_703]|nr:heterokaryon incompatibility protein-domain-containing protein [Xylogone sp. PMI_703]
MDSGLLYRPLGVAKNEIRLISITAISAGESDDEPVKCTLAHVSLGLPPSYVALSYCWGDPNRRADIIVDGQKVSVTVSLETALRRFRRDGHNTVWADALCINQQDSVEKSLQIRNMAAIYRRASSVQSWLGSWDSCQHAVSCLKTLSLGRKGPGDNLRGAEWETILSFFNQPYWTRAWIVQEMALSGNLQFLCGETGTISMSELQSALDFCSNIRDTSKLAEAVLETLGCRHFIEVHSIRSQLLQAKPLRLIEALSLTHRTLATEKRDKVFAILGLTYDANILMPLPTYEESVDLLSREMTLADTKSINQLDMIALFARGHKAIANSASNSSKSQVKNNEESITWVIDWFEGNTWADELKSLYLFGKARFHKGIYQTFTNTWASTWSSRPNFRILDKVLKTKGFVLDRIAYATGTFFEDSALSFEVSETLANNINSDDRGASPYFPHSGERELVLYLMFLLMCYMYHYGSLSIREYISTTVDEGRENVAFSQETCRRFFDLFIGKKRQTKDEQQLNLIRRWFELNERLPLGSTTMGKSLQSIPNSMTYLQDEFPYVPGHPSPIIDEVVAASTYKILERNQRFAASLANPNAPCMCYFGWVPEGTRVGDYFVLLEGCTMPVVLRQRPAGGFWLVGNALLDHSVMFGATGKLGDAIKYWPEFEIY